MLEISGLSELPEMYTTHLYALYPPLAHDYLNTPEWTEWWGRRATQGGPCWEPTKAAGFWRMWDELTFMEPLHA